MSKVISINPDLFRFTNNRTMRKRKTNSGSTDEIKVKAPKEKPKTMKKHPILRFMRDQQEKNYRKLAEGAVVPATTISSSTSSSDTETAGKFASDFEQSLQYLSALSDQVKQTPVKHNQTLRNYNQNPTQSLLFHPSPILGGGGGGGAPLGKVAEPYVDENVSLQMPSELTSIQLPPVLPPSHSAPTWGCLKGGTLPTYRTWNKTRRNVPAVVPQVNPPVQAPVYPGPSSTPTAPSLLAKPTYPGPSSTPTTPQFTSNVGPSLPEIKQMMKQMATATPKQKLRYPKHKRTVRRTYRIGKSKIHPRVSVLISNKTLRNQITTKKQLLKQTPLDEVKRFLVKKGFIRVGTSAPNDVLRTMYETASLMCGEIQNHNADNLLYNFLHDTNTNTNG